MIDPYRQEDAVLQQMADELFEATDAILLRAPLRGARASGRVVLRQVCLAWVPVPPGWGALRVGESCNHRAVVQS